MTTLFNWSSYSGQNEDKTLLQRSQRCHKGKFRHVSITTRQRSLRCRQSSWAFRGPFLRATLPDRALERWRTTGRQKGSWLHHQGEFLHYYYTFVSLHYSDHDGVVRIFVALSCELGGFFIYIILHYKWQPL